MLFFSSFIMGLLCYGFQLMMDFPHDTFMRIGVMGLWILGSVFAYILTARFVGAFQFRDVQKLMKNQPSS